MNPPSVDVKDILVAAGVGTFAATSGWSIYIAQEPEYREGYVPHTVISIYDTGGFSPSPKWLQDNPTVQIRVRGPKANGNYQTAYAKALAVRDALLGYGGQVINGTRYVGIWALGDIGFLEYDGNARPVFTLNFKITREPSSGTYRS